MRKSRLSKNAEKKNRKTIILSIIGIIIILYILFKFGLSFLVNFSLFISGLKNPQNFVSSQNQINFLPAPTLNPLPIATNSAKIIITGKSNNDFQINLYINNQRADQVQTDKNGNFSFSETLEDGDNQIKVNAQYKDKKSDFSNILNIIFKNSPPSLEVNSPTDGQSFKKDQNSVNVTGKTEPGVNVTVNGLWAVIDENNNFSYILSLQNGDNEIKIVAVDQAGNKAEKDLKVNYSQ